MERNEREVPGGSCLERELNKIIHGSDKTSEARSAPRQQNQTTSGKSVAALSSQELCAGVVIINAPRYFA